MTAIKEVHFSGDSGEIRFISLPATVKCPVLLIGKNSVRPCIIPRNIASMIVTI